MAEKLPRSPYDAIKGLVYFPRMLDKIRLQAAGQLPAAYHEFLGDGFDGRCCRFFKIDYADLKKQVLAGGSDEQVFAWAHQAGWGPDEEAIEVWSGFMSKRGWRDEARERIDFRLKEAGLEDRATEAVTMFDFIDLDEGRTPPDFSKWEPPKK